MIGLSPSLFLRMGGGLENFQMQTFFFVSVFPQKLFFTCIQLILFQCLQPLHTNYFKIFQPTPPPPPPHQNNNGLPLK